MGEGWWGVVGSLQFCCVIIFRKMAVIFFNTSLIIAACTTNFIFLDELLQVGADVNETKKDGYTALMFAAQRDDTTSSQKPLQVRAHISIYNNALKVHFMSLLFKPCETMILLYAVGENSKKNDYNLVLMF